VVTTPGEEDDGDPENMGAKLTDDRDDTASCVVADEGEACNLRFWVWMGAVSSPVRRSQSYGGGCGSSPEPGRLGKGLRGRSGDVVDRRWGRAEEGGTALADDGSRWPGRRSRRRHQEEGIRRRKNKEGRRKKESRPLSTMPRVPAARPHRVATGGGQELPVFLAVSG
jgi:hypothetical protein